MGRVTHLFRAPKKRAPMEELKEAMAVRGFGLEGCAHGRPLGKRQVLLMDEETLRDFRLAPGIVRENVTTEGLDVNGLQVGQRLKVGEVELEVSLVCAPCEQIEALRPGLEAAMQGKRGMLCRVTRGGRLRVGDEIALMESAAR